MFVLTLTDDKLLKFVLILGKSCVAFVWGEKLGCPRTLFIILLTTLEKLNCFHSEHRRGYQTKLLTDHSNGGRLTVEVRFAKMTGDRH